MRKLRLDRKIVLVGAAFAVGAGIVSACTPTSVPGDAAPTYALEAQGTRAADTLDDINARQLSTQIASTATAVWIVNVNDKNVALAAQNRLIAEQIGLQQQMADAAALNVARQAEAEAGAMEVRAAAAATATQMAAESEASAKLLAAEAEKNRVQFDADAWVAEMTAQANVIFTYTYQAIVGLLGLVILAYVSWRAWWGAIGARDHAAHQRKMNEIEAQQAEWRVEDGMFNPRLPPEAIGVFNGQLTTVAAIITATMGGGALLAAAQSGKDRTMIQVNPTGNAPGQMSRLTDSQKELLEFLLLMKDVVGPESPKLPSANTMKTAKGIHPDLWQKYINWLKPLWVKPDNQGTHLSDLAPFLGVLIARVEEGKVVPNLAPAGQLVDAD